MTYAGDPYRVLGLAPGASLDEVKHAYRRLAKRYHPDSAGDVATSRFLAVQAAYEALLAGGPNGRSASAGRRSSGSTARRRPSPGARPGSAGSAGGGSAARAAGPSGMGRRPPWEADPERTRATHEAYRRGRPGATGDAEARGGPGATGDPAAGRADDGGRADPGGRTDAGGAAEPRGRPNADGRSTTGRRAVRKARPGSTSYDEAEHDTADPRWQGATWYGQSSGTYWTINPREYADPRKHGPEYQARARRAAEGSAASDVPTPPQEGPVPGGSAAPGDSPAPEGSAPEGSATSDRRAFGGDPTRSSTAFASAGRTSADGSPSAVRSSTVGGSRAGAGSSATFGHPPTWGGEAWPASGPPRGASAPARRAPRIWPTSRLVVALIGWPLAGAAAATAVGQLTGCGRYAASCAPPVDLAGLAIQPLVVVALLLAHRLAEAVAAGSLAVALAAIPAAVTLSAAGGANAHPQAAAILGLVLGLAFLVGAAAALSGRLRLVERIDARLPRYDDRHGPPPLDH